jgi:cytochrome b subunit of formate dehydrogenase
MRWSCILLPAAILALAAAAQQPDNSACQGCHEEGQKVAVSAHSNVACSSCHTKHDDYPHPANIPKPKCETCHEHIAADYRGGVHGQAVAKGNQGAPDCETCHGAGHEVKLPDAASFRANVPETCGMCHSEIVDQYKTSVHGKAIAQGNMSAPVCSDCHGEHNILPPDSDQSPVNARNVRNTCGQCHGNVALAKRLGLPQDRLTTFDASFHGLAAASGAQTVANCASCHGIHNILPSKDAKSMVNAKNLPQTCGKCHPGAGTRFAIGPVHLQEGGAKEPAAIHYVRGFYWLVIPGTIGLMLLHNAGDWFRKLVRFYRGGPMSRIAVPSDETRMARFERLQHFLLATSFIVLAWSGLALKFPDAFWAKPLLIGEHLGLRRNIHRTAAVVMTAVSFMHLFSLIFSRGLRERWTHLAPRLRDVTDALHNTAYNLGLRKTKPALPSHSYIEKAEYWAVVWGTAVMVATGSLLWANNWSMHFLPKWFLDAATAVHWYEAVLASLAILVWHLYTVILDPEVYPMDTAWLSGKSPRARQVEEVIEEPVSEPVAAGD